MKNVPTKSTGDQLTAIEFNLGGNDELKNTVESGDQVLAEGDQFQVAKGIANYSAAGDFFVDSGAADAYVLSAISPRQNPTKFIDGMRLRFKPLNTCTGASTVNAFALGVKDIKHQDGTDPREGQIIKDKDIEIIFDETNDYFIISDISVEHLPRNYRSGVILENNSSDPINDIDFGIGKWRSNDDTTNLELGAIMTKQADAPWAAGTNAGGFPSGLAIVADTWYHCFLIAKEDGTTDAGFDTDLAAANLLADATGYTKIRRVGSIKTEDLSVNIRQFIQYDDLFLWGSPDTTVDYTGNPVAAADATTNTPLGIKTQAYLFGILEAQIVAAETRVYGYLSSKDVSDLDPNTVFGARSFTLQTNNARPTVMNGDFYVVTNITSQIRVRTSPSVATVALSIGTKGWRDFFDNL